jgi:hypothetical protein
VRRSFGRALKPNDCTSGQQDVEVHHPSPHPKDTRLILETDVNLTRAHCLVYVAPATQRQNAANVIVFVRGWRGISNEKDNRGCDALSGADVFSSDGPRAHRRRCAGGIIWRPCARTSWCRGRSHCRLYRGTIDCERLGFKTIKLSPAAGRARSKCKLQIIRAAKRSLCGSASNSSTAICRIRSTTRPAAGVRRGGVAADPLPDADTPEYSGSGTIHDPIMMRFR